MKRNLNNCSTAVVLPCCINTGWTLECYLSYVVCCTVVFSPMRCEYGLPSHMCTLSVLSLTYFTTRAVVRNKDTAARSTAREQITADAKCAVLAGVVANLFLCVLTPNIPNLPTLPAMQQYSLATHTSNRTAVLQCLAGGACTYRPTPPTFRCLLMLWVVCANHRNPNPPIQPNHQHAQQGSSTSIPDSYYPSCPPKLPTLPAARVYSGTSFSLPPSLPGIGILVYPHHRRSYAYSPPIKPNHPHPQKCSSTV